MHDDYIVEYSVNIAEKKLVIQTYNHNEKKQKRICFYDVLTHSFKCILHHNQILDISECEIDSFIVQNKFELKELAGYCWPIHYQNEEELKAYLIANDYKYIKLNSSYGLFGWILAKSYQISDLQEKSYGKKI